jgi:hypothetical protein
VQLLPFLFLSGECGIAWKRTSGLKPNSLCILATKQRMLLVTRIEKRTSAAKAVECATDFGTVEAVPFVKF